MPTASFSHATAALRRDDAEPIRTWANSGADLNERTANGSTLLMLAVNQGALHCAGAIAALPGVDVNIANLNCHTALLRCFALSTHGESMMRLLLARSDLDVDQTLGPRGPTALGLAADHDFPEFAALLLPRASSLDETDSGGRGLEEQCENYPRILLLVQAERARRELESLVPQARAASRPCAL